MTSPDLEFYCSYSDRCYECCLETEMPLAEKDITRISKLGFQIDEFLEEKDGFMVLRNKEGMCFFLKESRCTIYENRPEGCRYYPLIYDLDTDEFIIDDLCAHFNDFDPSIYQPLHELIRYFIYTLLSEKEIRAEKTREEERKRKKGE
ncbi:MAG: hypothetical protein HeimAB125_06100 [Candidatus Heimdallarchaeota archaeon AB_125]|nr:MAG: hypothetical protein HeimAB125_06100 [Candidatus Heimdallarchaeota archaeon AB_125]